MFRQKNSFGRGPTHPMEPGVGKGEVVSGVFFAGGEFQTVCPVL